MKSAGDNLEPEPVRWAMDTETENGRAVLLTVAGPEGRSGLLEFPGNFPAAVRWLSGIARKYVCYNMDYDARALLKLLPPATWTRLYRTERCLWRGWKIYYRPGKEFTVHGPGGVHVMLYDVASFFQRSLKEACRETFQEEVKEEIPKSWYARIRDILVSECCKDSGIRCGRCRRCVDRGRLIRYALRDAEACRRLWAYLDDQFRRLGVPAAALGRPLSPGSVAASYFGKRLRCGVADDANWTAKKAYAGGRIEVLKRGRFRRVWIYDLKSAYPWALSTLPDPRGSRAVWSIVDRPDALYSVWKARLTIPPGMKIPPIPAWANEGGSPVRIYPTGCWTTWITGPERDLLMRLHPRGVRCETLAGLHLCGVRRPWVGDEIRSLFLKRKTHPEISQAVKLVLNSIYGKLAQTEERNESARVIDSKVRRVGGHWLRARQSLSGTSNFFVAAYVTALVRLRMWEAMDRQPDDVVLAATDGLMLENPMKGWTDEKGALGSWECSASKVQAIVVGSGVYAVRSGETWADKMRGHRLERPLHHLLDRPGTRVPTVSQIAYTLGDYAVRGADMNVIARVPKTLDVNFDRKRAWEKPWRHGRDVLRSRMSSEPLIMVERGNDGRREARNARKPSGDKP